MRVGPDAGPTWLSERRRAGTELHRGNPSRLDSVESSKGSGDQRHEVRQTIAPGNENEDCYRPAAQVLLASQILIGRYQDLEAVRLGGGKQCPVLEGRPATFVGGMHFMAGEMVSKRPGNAVIQE